MTRYAEVRWADVRHARCLHIRVSVVHTNDEEFRSLLEEIAIGQLQAYNRW